MPLSIYNWQQPDTSGASQSLLSGMRLAQQQIAAYEEAARLRQKDLQDSISKMFADRRAAEAAKQKHALDIADSLRQDRELQAQIDHWKALEDQQSTRATAGSEPFKSPFTGTVNDSPLPSSEPPLDTAAIPSEPGSTSMDALPSTPDLPSVSTNGSQTGPETLIPEAPKVDYAAEIRQAAREAERLGIPAKSAPSWINTRASALAREKRLSEKPQTTNDSVYRTFVGSDGKTYTQLRSGKWKDGIEPPPEALKKDEPGNASSQTRTAVTALLKQHTDERNRLIKLAEKEDEEVEKLQGTKSGKEKYEEQKNAIEARKSGFYNKAAEHESEMKRLQGMLEGLVDGRETPKQIAARIKAAGGTKEDLVKALHDAGYTNYR